MDNKKLLMAGAAMVALTGLAAHEAEAVTQAINMNALILAPIQLSEAQAMDFGSVTVDSLSAGTVVIDRADGRTATGGVTLVGGVPKSGVLGITSGATGRTMQIQAVASANVNNGTATMLVNAFDVDGLGNRTLTTSFATIPATVPIGATLNVGAAQATGTYTGTFNVTVNYN